MKILIVSDAWAPQINGVVRTLMQTKDALQQMGHVVEVIGPDPQSVWAWAVPFYTEITLEFFAGNRITEEAAKFNPDFIHIATEGPLGWAARRYCMRHNRPFTTSYHTRFPEYLAARVPAFLRIFVRLTAYAVLRRFHAPAAAVMVATPSIEHELRGRKFFRLVRWWRGVDADLFQPYGKNLAAFANLPRPILLSVGRIAVEKNLRAFLDLKTSGCKIVIGDGPDRSALADTYKDVHFLGMKQGEDLARHYAAADLFVFPSRTDTFGLVLLEACAAGLRIAAYPAPGPVDIFNDPVCQTFCALDEDLQQAVDRALTLADTPDAARGFAQRFSWPACAAQFYAHLQAPSPVAKKRLARWRRKIGE